MFIIKKAAHNPLICPMSENLWESLATFNWCPVKNGKNIDVLYRAMSLHQDVHGQDMSLSVIGHATSRDGVNFKQRKELIRPEEQWEKFGCEDPRVTKLNNKYYIFYTALAHYPFEADGIKVGLAISKDLKTIQSKHLITPFNAKAMSLFPEKINGKFTAILTANTDKPPAKIAIIQFDKEEEMWSEDYWENWYKTIDEYTIHLTRKDNDHVEVGSSPLKTKDGWLFIYCHIQNYFHGNKIFGIEAFVTDLKNPTKILKRTSWPFLVPEENYELNGHVKNIVFPSGALIDGKKLKIFYGAADTVCALAETDLALLLASMEPKKSTNLIKRYNKNPLISPDKKIAWKSKAVFNPGAIEINGKIHLMYRAMGEDNTSVIGYAATKNGFNIIDLPKDPAYVPRKDFEDKHIPNGNSGCEDPRLTKIGNILYMFYTAYNGVLSPAVAMTSIKVSDFIQKKWNWEEPFIVYPCMEDNKDACLMPDKINGEYFYFHRIGRSISLHSIKSLAFADLNLVDCIKLISPRPGMWDSQKVGLTSPPLKTQKGWLLFYHGIDDRGVYRIGAALLDLKNPKKVIARSADFIMEPETSYELKGQTDNVVFPCGTIERKGIIFLYYGAADKVIALATLKLKDILSMF